MTSKKTLKAQSGFTLIEVLIALTIFAVGLLAIAALQTSAIRMNSTAGRLTDLSTCGMDQLENLMSLPYTSHWLEAVDSSTPDSTNVLHQVPSPDGFYTIGWDIQQDALTPNTKTIKLTVSGRGKMLRLTAVRSQSL